MTKNPIMIKEKQERKSPMRVNETGCTNAILKTENMSAKRKKTKRLSTKSRKSVRKLGISNLSLKYNERMYENQIQQLNLMFKQSVMRPTLTQNELDVLSMKYKVDGHYRINNNLPPFKTLLDNTHNVFNGKADSYEQMQYISNNDMQELKHRNNAAYGEGQSLENSSTYGTLQPNFTYDLPKATGILKVNNGDKKIDNRYFCTIDATPTNSNHSYLCMNHTMQAQNNINILEDIKDFALFKPSTNTKYMSDLKEQFSYSSRSGQNIIPEEHQTYSNLFSNVPDSNAQLAYLDNTSETSMQNAAHSLLQHNSFSLHANFCNNLHFNKWNNVTPTSKNNCQSLKSAQLICIPRIANLESRYNIKNSATAHQITLIKDHTGEEDNLNSFNHTNIDAVNNKISVHTFNSDVNRVQQDYDPCLTNTNGVSDTFLPEINTFIPLSAGFNDDYH